MAQCINMSYYSEMRTKELILIALTLLVLGGFTSGQALAFLNHSDPEITIDHGGVARECDFCHESDPFDQKNTQTLTEPTIEKLCFSCHDQFKLGFGAYGKAPGGHPVDGHPTSGPVDPKRAEKKFSCSSCHNPHGSPQPFMFRYKYNKRSPDGECFVCHQSIGSGGGTVARKREYKQEIRRECQTESAFDRWLFNCKS
jgi:predicted CXXCH cytochrome family protein